MATRRVRSVPILLGLVGACLVVAGLAFWVYPRAPVAATEDSAGPSGHHVTAAEHELLRRAEERLIKRCMTKHGLAYAEQPSAPPVTRSFPYVVDDVAWARRYGFGDLAGASEAWKHDVNYVELERMTPARQRAWMETLQGTGFQLKAVIPDLGKVSSPDNGCTAEARRTLYRDLAGWYRVRRVVDHFGTYTGNDVRRDAHYERALAAWASCVRHRGYPADNPDELRTLVTREFDGVAHGQAHATEVAAAETEAICAKTTGLTQTIRSLEKRYRPPVERRFARERKALELYEQQAVPRARQILAGS